MFIALDLLLNLQIGTIFRITSTNIHLSIISSCYPLTKFILFQDLWKEPKSYDNRRYYGNEYMKAAGQAVAASMNGLYSVLSKWPLRNEGTSYTSMMNPKTFEMVSYDVYYSNNTLTQ